MSIGIFVDKKHQPKQAELEETIGSMLNEWTSLAQDFRETYHTQEDFKFLYGSGYGWALRFRTKGKLLSALFPNRGYFVALIILNSRQLADVGSLRLHRNAQCSIDSAKLYKEGKWLFLKVENHLDGKDVRQLIKLKAMQASVLAGK